LEDHVRKLAEYIRDPISQDVKGFLRAAGGGTDRYYHIFERRVRSLIHQIRNFSKQLDELPEEPPVPPEVPL
jgi:hypothetical protein